MPPDKPRRLGRGLEALIANAAAPPLQSGPSTDLQRIPLAAIQPNPFQPRHSFQPGELAELESSIRASGLLQPVTVRRVGTSYQLVAGERRLRAVTELGWHDIPAIVRDFDDQAMLVLALVENLQRADLNPIEEARGYKRLADEFSLTQQQIAAIVGRDRTTITNLLRVLTLPTTIHQMVEAGHLTIGHARALLVVDDNRVRLALANDIVAEGLSVRQAEQRARRAIAEGRGDAQPTRSRTSSTPTAPDAAVQQVADALRRYLQTDVQVALRGPAKGAIQIAFYSNDDLDRLLDLILKAQRRDF